MAVNIKISVGRRRIPANLDPKLASYTRQIRDQVRGIIEDIKFFYKEIEDVTPEVLKDALQPVFDESQRIVPVDTRKLQLSGYLVSEDVAGGGTVEIGYARGGRPEYGVIVHENLETFHESPTKAKFLEGPLNEMFFQVQRRIVDSFKSAVRGRK